VQAAYAVALIRTGEFKRAIGHAKVAVTLRDSEFSVQTLSLAAYLLNDLDTAKQWSEKTLEINEDNLMALEILAGVAFWKESGTPRWLAKAEKVKKLNQQASWALIFDYFEMRRTDKAAALQKLALAKSAAFPNELPYILLAQDRLYSSTDSDFGAAANELQPALSRWNENPRLLGFAIFVDLLQKKYELAARHFSALQDSAADPLDVFESGCLFYVPVGKPRAAMENCKKVVDSKPDNHTAHSNYAWAALDANEYSLALSEFSFARTLMLADTSSVSEQSMVDLSWGLILANWWSGNEDEAKRIFDLLAANSPSYINLAYVKKLPLVWSDLQLSRIEGAINHWRPK
jgi:tetratricopeptide (TPR) repeat protein